MPAREVYGNDIDAIYGGLDKLRLDLDILTNRFWQQRGQANTDRIVRGIVHNDGTPVDVGTGDWSADIAGNFMVITFDPVFPSLPEVIVEPTLDSSWDGDTSIFDPTLYSFGNSSGTPGSLTGDERGNTVLGKFTNPSTGTFQHLTFTYRMSGGLSTFSVQGCVYADSGGSPGAQVTDVAPGTFFGTSTPINVNGTLNFPGDEVLAAGDYWIALAVVSGANAVNIGYDASSGIGLVLSGDTSLSDPYPGGGSSDTNGYALRVNGSASVGNLEDGPDAVSGFSRVYIAPDKVGVVWWDKDGAINTGYIPFSFVAVGSS